MERDSTKYFSKFSGGSMADTYLVGRNTELYVRKQMSKLDDNPLGLTKLKEQAQWLIDLDDKLKPYFPKLIATNDYYDNVWYYDMEYLNIPTLSDYLIKCDYVEPSKLYKLINKILSFTLKAKEFNKSAPSDYITNIINKMEERCLSIDNDAFKSLLSLDILTVNGDKYLNFNSILKLIKHNTELLNLIQPNKLQLVHGDLTFQNVLTNGTDVTLIDPRGGSYESLYFDLGKLLQSCDAKYDLLCHGDYEFKVTNNEIKFNVNNNDNFNYAYSSLINTLNNAMTNDNWQLIVKFYEAYHFIVMLPFRHAQDFELTIICYVIGVRLLNEVLKDFITMEELNCERRDERQ